jgi:hypothetical protein
MVLLFSSISLYKVTVRDALSDLPPIEPGSIQDNIPLGEPQTDYQRRMRFRVLFLLRLIISAEISNFFLPFLVIFVSRCLLSIWPESNEFQRDLDPIGEICQMKK